MNVFRALLVRFFGFDYVFLIHHDGEHQLRRAFVVGKYFFSYSYFKSKKCRLLPNGQVIGKSYIIKWLPVTDNTEKFYYSKDQK